MKKTILTAIKFTKDTTFTLNEKYCLLARSLSDLPASCTYQVVEDIERFCCGCEKAVDCEEQNELLKELEAL